MKKLEEKDSKINLNSKLTLLNSLQQFYQITSENSKFISQKIMHSLQQQVFINSVTILFFIFSFPNGINCLTTISYSSQPFPASLRLFPSCYTNSLRAVRSANNTPIFLIYKSLLFNRKINRPLRTNIEFVPLISFVF